MKEKQPDILHLITYISTIALIAILIILFLYSIIFNAPKDSDPTFLDLYSGVKLQDISARYLVFFTILIHITRIHFGICFLQFDKSYLHAGETLGEGGISNKSKTIFIIINLLFSFALSNFLFSDIYMIIPILLLGQSLIILWYDWANRAQLFCKDVDRKSNLLIILGDLGFFFFGLGIFIFQYFLIGNIPENNAIGPYFCLSAFLVLELLALVLIMETIFTYKEGLVDSFRKLIEIAT